MTQLRTLQNYLRMIYNRGEINDDEYNSMRPQSTKPAQAHGLPKTHKPYDNLPPLSLTRLATRTMVNTILPGFRSLINRAYKICNNDRLLSDEINNIMKFMSWNSFPKKKLATTLIQKFTPRANQIYNNSKNNHWAKQSNFVKSSCGCHT